MSILTPAGTITDIFETSDGYLLNLEIWCPGTTIWHWTDGDMSFPMNPHTRKPVGTDGEDLDGTFLYERTVTPPMTDADYTRLAQAAIRERWAIKNVKWVGDFFVNGTAQCELCLDPTTFLNMNHDLNDSPIDVERALAALQAELDAGADINLTDHEQDAAWGDWGGAWDDEYPAFTGKATIYRHQPWTGSEGDPILFVQVILTLELATFANEDTEPGEVRCQGCGDHVPESEAHPVTPIDPVFPAHYCADCHAVWNG
jgi:hypothetical protein